MKIKNLLEGLNAQQRSVPQLPAQAQARHISVLGAKKDPKHPFSGYMVGADESAEPGKKRIGPDKNDPFEKGWRARHDDANPYAAGTPEHQQWQHGRDEREAQPNHYDEGVAEGSMYSDEEVSWEKGGRRAPTGAFRNPAAGGMPVNKYIANELDTLLKLCQDQVEDIVNRSRDGYGNKKSAWIEDAIFEISGLSNGFHSSMEEGVAELQELNSGLPRIGKWIIGSLKNIGNKIDLPLLIKQEMANEKSGVAEEWSQKYKSSINCSHPKGFSQKAHCAGKKKHNESVDMEMVCEDCGMCETHGNINEIKKGQKDSNGYTRCWPGKHAAGTKKGKNGGQVRNCVPNESQGMAEGKKVDRFVGYVEKSEEKAGKSKKDAENIAWATANKRGYLESKGQVDEISRRGFLKGAAGAAGLGATNSNAVSGAWNTPSHDAYNRQQADKARAAAQKQQAERKARQEAEAKARKEAGLPEPTLWQQAKDFFKEAERNEMDTPAVQKALKNMSDRHKGEKWSKEQLAALGKRIAARGQKPVKEDIAKEDIITKLKAKLGDYLSDLGQQIKKDPALQDKLAAKAPGDQVGPPVKTITTDDGHEISIHGNEDDGFRISIKNKQAPSKFSNLDEAVMACEMYCAHRRKQALNADYVDEA